MPVITHKDLPAVDILKEQNIIIMNEERATKQDIRPLQIAILNLMPLKVETETQLLLLLSNSPIQIEITLLHPETYSSKNTPEEHLITFYKTFKDIKHQKFDGFIITGAPVELMEFEEVNYWDELKEILDYTRTNVTSTMHICWGAQAGLYHHYGIQKYLLPEKMFGVFKHKRLHRKNPLFRGFDDTYFVPHSRHTEIREEDIKKCPELTVQVISEESGVHIVSANNNRQIYITGHSEYDRNTLKNEYERDLKKGLDIQIPKNYFPNDDPTKKPVVNWRSHANLWFHNWINFVYQQTPFDINEIK